MKQIILLGASGSIGEQTLDVIKAHPEEFELVAFSVGKRIEKVHEILKEFPVHYICVQDLIEAEKLKQQYPNITVFAEDEGLKQLVSLPIGDIVLNALVGFVGLLPTLCAIEHKKDIALANKETLVVGGKFIQEALQRNQVHLYPVDSEHSAIDQCLKGYDHESIDKLIITASGGSFRDLNREQLRDVTVEQALAHPNWSMGAKITIDSATMMNKGFEVIEAHYLFDIDYDKIDVLMHKESIVHSMVQFKDGAILAQLGSADMRLPIQFALAKRQRLNREENFDLAQMACLHFDQANEKRYPLLALAYECGRLEGNACAILNAANEVAVHAFLRNEISFLKIEECIQQALQKVHYITNPTLEEVIETDKITRDFVNQYVKGGV